MNVIKSWKGQFDSPIDAARWILDICTDARIFCFTGDLGSGKTTTIQSCCRTLGYHGEVTSPTYAIINEYVANQTKIFHMDLYRLKDLEEALDIGLDEYLDDEEAYSFIEWPQLVHDYFDISCYDIQISRLSTDSETRTIIITYKPSSNHS